MNKIQILTKNVHTFFIDRLKQEARSQNVGLEFINPWEDSCPVPSRGPMLVRTTSIHGTDHDLDYIRKYDLKTLPSLKALEVLRTKPKQFEYFATQDIGHLPWLNLKTCSLEEIISFAKISGKLLIKPQRGQGGWGVRIFNDTNELLSWWKESRDREYLLQPYIEDHEEIRIFFMKESFIALKRIKKGVAANFRQDGQAWEVQLPDELLKVVEKIKWDLGLIYGAADFLVTPLGSYILEMNLVPGIEQLEMVTGRNIAGELIPIFLNS